MAIENVHKMHVFHPSVDVVACLLRIAVRGPVRVLVRPPYKHSHR